MVMLRVRTVFTGVAGAPWYNNLYVSGQTQENAEDAASLIAAYWESVKAYMSIGIVADVEDDVPVIDPADGTISTIRNVATASISGTNNADPLPRYTQMLVRLRTAGVVAGRRVQGRTFLPGWGEGSSTNGRPNTGDVTIIQNAWVALLDDLATANVPLVVWSRPVDGGRAGSQHVVENLSVWSEWSVLRSRRD